MFERRRQTVTIDLVQSPKSGAWEWNDKLPKVNIKAADGTSKPKPARWRAGLGWKLALAAGVGTVVVVALSLPSGSMAQQPNAWRQYVPSSGAVGLRDAITTGMETGLPLFACRGKLAGALQVGRYRSDFAGCHVGLNGKEIEITPFELLTATWQNPEEGGRSFAPQIAGQTLNSEALAANEDGGTALAPCRAVYQSATHIGQTSGNGMGCSFGYGGKTITSQNFMVLLYLPWLTWTPASAHSLPGSALAGGEEGGEPQYVCRAQTPQGLMTGKIKQSSVGCSVAAEGKELVVTRFEVMVPRWVVGSGAAVPVSASPVGRDHAGLLYLCRGTTQSMVEPGELSEKLAGCHVGMQGSDVVLQNYEVLGQ